MRHRILAISLLFVLGLFEVKAQDVIVPKAQQRRENLKDSLKLEQLDQSLDSMQLALLQHVKDSIARLDSIRMDSVISAGKVSADSTLQVIPKKAFMPDPKKSLWYAIAFPGGGQIYNRKYWKLPIVYGGFLGCYYALSWNNSMYRDYSQAYIDIMDSDPKTHSYTNFLPPTYDAQANEARLKEIFKNKKDFYRRYRDLSFFCMIGVYVLSIVDAYVDAELSSFDISPDLSLKVKPSVIRDNNNIFLANHGLRGNSYGLQCSLDF